MTEDQYLAESSYFDTPDKPMHIEKVKPAEIDAMLHAASVATNWADRIKRTLFYGAALDPKALNIPTSLQIDSVSDRHLVHGILGLFTEAGELMQHLHDVLSGEAEVDRVNLIEELGDCYWYAALLHRLTGSKFSDAMQTNIAKLKARYPDRFTEHAALNRDLGAEREVLEKNLIGFDAGDGK